MPHQLTKTFLIVGMAGTGKSTFSHRLYNWLGTRSLLSINATSCLNNNITSINLDPATLKVKMPLDLDIREYFDYENVMETYNLGPNGAVTTIINLFLMRWSVDKLSEFVIIDTPGQIEAFVWSNAGKVLVEKLMCYRWKESQEKNIKKEEVSAKKSESEINKGAAENVDNVKSKTENFENNKNEDVGDSVSKNESLKENESKNEEKNKGESKIYLNNKVILLYLIDSSECQKPSVFMCNMIYALILKLRFNVPILLVFNKIDISPLPVNWLNDYEKFMNDVNDDNMSNSLLGSMALYFEEYYRELDFVGVSAITGEGREAFFECVDKI